VSGKLVNRGKRPRCKICGRPVVSRGIVGGKQYWRSKCSKCRHETERYNLRDKVERGKCVLCDWEGPCDLHRVIFGKDGGSYTQGNVLAVCPNCHRLIHTGQLRIEHQGQETNDEQEPMLFEV